MTARLVALWVLLAAAAALGETRRLAIVVGNNAGSGDMPPLRYAESDAGKMARVLVELGEVEAGDVALLQGRGVAELERAIADARARAQAARRAPDTRVVVVFYFSGHSDGEAIELGREKLPYPRLKALLAGTGADVRVAIVDACRSGAGIREKGGRQAEPFSIRLTDTLNATGDAFITSSAADEAALESSEVMGSYFTHNFISGLRGAADASGDRLVTLSEAYRYAYDRTVSATAALPVGIQHPNYDYKLSGQGELVLATLLRPSAALVLPDADRVLVTDLARDQVVVELPQGASREVALAPGQYGLRVFKDGQGFGGRVTLSEGSRRVVKQEDLLLASSSVAVAKKGGELRETAAPLAPELPFVISVGFGATSKIVSDPVLPSGPKWQVRLGVEPWTVQLASTRIGARRQLVQLLGELTVMGVGEISTDNAPQGVEPVNEAGLQLRAGYRFSVGVGRVTFGLGVEAGVGLLVQLFGEKSSAGAFDGGPRATLRVRLSDEVALTLDGDVTVTAVQVMDGGKPTIFLFTRPSLYAGLAFLL